MPQAASDVDLSGFDALDEKDLKALPPDPAQTLDSPALPAQELEPVDLSGFDALDAQDTERDRDRPKTAINNTSVAEDLVAAATGDTPLKEAAAEAESALKRVILSKGPKSTDTLSDAINELEGLGVRANSILAGSTEFAAMNRSELDAEFVRGLRSMGLWEVRDHLDPDVVRRLRGAHAFKFALARSPLPPEDHEHAGSRVIEEMLREAETRLDADYQGALKAGEVVAPEVAKEIEHRKGLIQLLRELPIQKRTELIPLTFKLAGRYNNAFEEHLVDRMMETDLAANWSIPVLPTRSIVATGASFMRKVMPITATRMNAIDRASLFEAAVGEGAVDSLRARYHNEVYARHAERLGFSDYPDGSRRPGYFDGVSFIPYVAEGSALQQAVKLSAGQIPSSEIDAIAESDPVYNEAAKPLEPKPVDFKLALGTSSGEILTAPPPSPRASSRPSRILAHADLYGDTAAYQRAKELGRLAAAHILVQAERRQELARMSDPDDLTPYMKSKLNLSTLEKTVTVLAGTLEGVLGAAGETARRVHDNISQLPFIQEMAKDAVFVYTGNEALAEAARSPADAFLLTYRGLQLADDVQNAPHLQRLAKENPQAYAEIVKELTLPAGEAVEDYLRSSMGQEETRQMRLASNKWDTPGEVLQGAKDVAGTTFFNLWYPLVHTATTLVDDLPTGLTYLGLGATGERGAKAMAAAKRTLYHKAFLSSSIKNTFASLYRWAPDELMVRYKGLVGRAMSRGADADQIRAMEGIKAIVDERMEGLRQGLTPDPHAAIRIGNLAKEAWTGIEDVFAPLVQEQLRAFGAENLFRRLDQRLFGKIRRPNRMIDAWQSGSLLNETERAVRNYIFKADPGAGVGGEATAVQREMKAFLDKEGRVPTRSELSTFTQRRRVEDFTRANGRGPSPSELADLMPPEMVSLPAVLQAGELVPARDPVWLKLLGRLTNAAQFTTEFEKLRATANQWLDDAHGAAAALVQAKGDWQITRARLDKLIGVVRHKVRGRLHRYETARVGLETMLADNPQNPRAQEWAADLEAVRAEEAGTGTKLLQIEKERDRLRAHRFDKRWELSGDPRIWEELDPELLHTVLDDNKALFGGMAPEAVVDVLQGRVNTARHNYLQTQLQAVDRRTARVRARMAELEKNPVKGDHALAIMTRKAAALEQRKARLERLPTNWTQPYRPEATRLAVSAGHRALFDALPKHMFRRARTVGDAINLLDELVQLADGAPDRLVVGNIPANLLEQALTEGELGRLQAPNLSRAALRRIQNAGLERLQRAVNALRQEDLTGAVDDLSWHTQARTGTVDLTKLDQDLNDLIMIRNNRRTSLASGAVKSDAWNHAYLFQERLRRLRRGIARASREAGQPEVSFVLNPDGARHLQDVLAHPGVESVPALRAAREQAGWLKAAKVVGMRSNPFRFGALPFYLKSAELHGASARVQGRLAAAMVQVEDMAATLNKMSPAQRRILGQAQREGRLPSELAGANVSDDVKAGLDRLYKRESKLFQDAINGLYEAGFVSKEEWHELLKAGYDPGLYGNYERAALVKAKDVRHLSSQAGAERRGGLGGPQRLYEHDELKLRRDVNKWRVRVDEPEAIVERTFDGLQEAAAWMREVYGDKVFADQRRRGAFLRGKTPFGDDYVVAKPLGPEAWEKLDPLGPDLTPEKRLKRLQDMWSNYFMHAYVESLNLFGGAVLEDTARNALFESHGAAVAGQFWKIPNDPKHFGSLSGKWVHKRVFAEMGQMKRMYGALSAIFEGMRESFSHYGDPTQIPQLFAEAGPFQRTLRGMDSVVKNTQILWNPGTWVANLAFNVALDTMAGTGVFNSANLHNLSWAIKQVLPGAHPEKRDQIFLDALEDGIVQGSFFEGSNDAMLKLGQRMVGLDTLDEVKALRGRRARALRDTMGETGYRTSGRRNVAESQAELAAIDARMHELSRSWLTKLVRKGVGFFYNLSTTTGLPENAVNAYARKLYNTLDEAFKLAAYKNVRDTYGRSHAKWRVKTFTQDYSRVPDQLRNNPFASLIVTFPYELARLSTNYARLRPYSFLAGIAAVPALNLTFANMAGVDLDRMWAMLETRGAVSTDEKIQAFMSTIMWWNPKTQNLDLSVNLKNLFPFSEQWTSRSYGGLITNNFNLDQSMPGTAAKMALGFGTQFFLNKPIVNLGVSLAGVDPVSGKQLTEANAPPLQQLKARLKSMAQQFVPPLTPIVGRSTERIMYAWSPPLNPKTGRGLREPGGFTTQLLKGTLNVDVRGRPTSALDVALGAAPAGKVREVSNDRDLVLALSMRAHEELGDLPGYDPQEYVESQRMDLREAYYRMVQEADPDKKAAAEKAFNDMIETHPQVFGGSSMVKGPTAKQTRAMVERWENEGALDLYARLPIDKQAAIMAAADRRGVHDETLFELAREMLTVEGGLETRESDPERVRRAITVLSERGGEEGANMRVGRLAAWLRDNNKGAVLLQAEVNERMEELNKVFKQKSKTITDTMRDLITNLAAPK